jgi:hypothetical protein
MILILKSNIDAEAAEYKQLMEHLSTLQNIQLRVHREQGLVAIFTQILLLFISSFAILFQVERRTMRTSYLFVTHITLDDFPFSSFIQHKF